MFWLVMVPILTIVLLPLLMKPDSFEIHQVEFERNASIVGKDANQQAIEQATSFHAKYMGSMCNKEVTNQNSYENESVIRGFGRSSGIHKSNATRCQQIVSGIYRIGISSNFFWGIIIFALAAFVDGLHRRSVDAYEFGYQSPLKFHVATHSFIIALGATVASAFIPITFNVMVWPAIIVAVSVSAWAAARHYQLGV